MDTNKKKICLVIPSLGPGGMERVMSILANYFVNKEKLEVHIILYGKKRQVFYALPEAVIIHKPDFNFDNKWRLWYTFKTLFFLLTLGNFFNNKP